LLSRELQLPISHFIYVIVAYLAVKMVDYLLFKNLAFKNFSVLEIEHH